MFANVGWGEMILLVVIGLVVLGPERLPGRDPLDLWCDPTGARLPQRRDQPAT